MRQLQELLVAPTPIVAARAERRRSVEHALDQVVVALDQGDLPLGEWGPPPVWRAGANASTRLNTEAALTFGDQKVPAGEYTLFIDVKSPTSWTLMV